MEKIKIRHFECVMKENSEEERKKQWERSEIIFDNFYKYLKNKGLNEDTASRRTNQMTFFIMNYFFIYEDNIENILLINDDTIRTFLGNWYIRKIMNPRMSEIKSFLRAISDFFTFVQKEDFISKEELQEMKQVCKDIEWFEMRLKTYFEVQGDDFYEWIQEYNYDYF